MTTVQSTSFKGTAVSAPEQLRAAAKADFEREPERERQCPHRKGGQCLLISKQMGWEHLTALKDCDSCYAEGGEKGGSDHRNFLVNQWLTGFKQPGRLAKLPLPIIETILTTHCTVEESKQLRADPVVASGMARGIQIQETMTVWDKAVSYGKSLASKGLTGKRVSLPLLTARKASCGLGGGTACPSMRESAVEGRHYCGDCGCGDVERALLDGQEGEYTKLDYPELPCPRRRRGFSNYRVTFNGDTGGMGDSVMHCWHAEGYKKQGIECVFHATDASRIELLEMFGQTVVNDPTDAIVLGANALHYRYELKVDKGQNPRALVWGSQLPDQPEPVRPLLKLLAGLVQGGAQARAERAGEKPLVLLFPCADWSPREWPLAYWLDLAWTLERTGVKTMALCPPDRQHQLSGMPFRSWGLSWPKVAALMLHADAVVGNDSGPAHMAGTIGVPTLALMGATSKIFSHMANVRELSLSPSRLACVGCHYDAEMGFRAACDVQCRALMLMEPGEAIEAVRQMLGSEKRKYQVEEVA